LAKKVILLLLGMLLLFSFSFVSAIPPVQISDPTTGLTISYPKIEYVKAGEEFNFHAHVFNTTNGLAVTNTSTSCFFHGYYSNGTHVIKENMTFESGGVDFAITIPAVLIVSGRYTWIVQCSSAEAGGFISEQIVISSTGEQLETGDAIIYSTLVIFLCLLFGLLLYILSIIPRDTKSEDDFVINVSKLEYLRPIVLGLGWILLTSIMFIVANVAVGFLDAGLLGEFLFMIFRLMGLSNLIIIPLCIIKMIQRIVLSKEMMGLVERGVEFK